MSKNGKNVLKMVRQMEGLYGEISNLMKSFEKLIGKKNYKAFKSDTSVFMGKSSALDGAKDWMPTRMYRAYKNNSNKKEIITINIVIDRFKQPDRISEPLIIVSNITFNEIRDGAWDPLDLYFYGGLYLKDINKVYGLKDIDFNVLEDERNWEKADIRSLVDLKVIVVHLMDIENEKMIQTKIIDPLLSEK